MASEIDKDVIWDAEEVEVYKLLSLMSQIVQKSKFIIATTCLNTLAMCLTYHCCYFLLKYLFLTLSKYKPI